MHESITIAEVGDIVKVSGSRIATPLAPPSPGSTPIRTPSVMPTNIRPMLSGVRTTRKPCSSEFSASMRACRSVAQERQRREAALEERHLEPDFEHGEEERVDGDADQDRLPHRVLAEHDHERRDVDRRGDVDADEDDRDDVEDRRHEHREDAAELLAVDEGAAVALGREHRLPEDAGAGDAQDQADVEREVARAGAIARPAGAERARLHDDDGANGEQHRRDDGVNAAVPRQYGLRRAGLGGRVAHYLARNPASVMSCLCIASAFTSQARYSAPLIEVVLKAPFSMKSFQSGVSRTFFSCLLYKSPSP